jgi:ubiquinone/menaquinone biosynthesis C-methylase UbiE
VSQRQDEASVRAAYDTVADTYADHFRSTEPELAVELAMVEHFVSLLQEPRRVIDAGCGAGRMMPVLAALGCEVEGIDLSGEMIRRAEADHGEFRFSVGSLSELPFADEAFDGVFSWYSTIHSPDEDLPQIFAEAARVLRPGGFLLVAFQVGSGLVDVSANYRRHGHEVALQRYNRTLEEMGAQLASAGFREVARFARAAAARERDGQGVLIAARL